jgi:hypothetical protein
MSNFFDEPRQSAGFHVLLILMCSTSRTRVLVEAYIEYAAGEKPRRTQLIGKMAFSRWKLIEHPTSD